MKRIFCLGVLPLLLAGCAKINAIKDDTARLPAIQKDTARLPTIQADAARLATIQTEMTRLPGIQADVAKTLDLLQKRDATVRVALIDGSRLGALTSEWRRHRLDEAMAKMRLTPEAQSQLDAYDRAESQFSAWTASQRRADPRNFGLPNMVDPRTDPEFQKQRAMVQAARAPVAEIVERRARLQSEIKYPLADLIAEYVRDRFDIVLDRSYSLQYMVYSRAKEFPDITEGVVALYYAKEQAASQQAGASGDR